MSGSLLDEKENVDSANECDKQDEAFTTSSILKPSQKLNVLQLTPKKAPKVTFKNTPILHNTTHCKAKLPQSPLDTWEEIRSLDEVENWTERTQIVTKEDHQLHLESAKEFLDDIISNLPCLESPKKVPELSKAHCEEHSPDNITPFKPLVNSVNRMDYGLDGDFAGPLDPAIASLNSLLKAGEEEERAFSPIGSGKVSPDCDNMVTSDDIEKLLTPHDMPEEVDIPTLELIHGNKIDAYMDSKFSGRHLDEVAAKLNELKLTSTTTDSMSTKARTENLDDSDEDLPVIPRRLQKSLLITEAKDENMEKSKEKENGNEEADLPVKRRPKASSKKESEEAPGEEKETFKKPMPPKPWKMKKKKVTQKSDPFDIVIAEPSKPPPNTTNSKPESGNKTKDTSIQEPSALEVNPSSDQAEKQREEAPRAKPSGQDGADRNGSENTVDLNGQNRVLFSEQQEDFGVGNDDFTSPGEAFSLELDYLEKFGGNTNNLNRPSVLDRQSLYIKFDPLCKGRASADQDLGKRKTEESAPTQTAGNIDDLLMNTPPDRRVAASKLTPIKEAEADKLKAKSEVDRLLTFSPAVKGAPTATIEDAPPPPQVTSKHEEDSSLVQPLLYSKSDIEVAVKKEREALLKQTNEDSQLRDMEIQEILSKLQNEVESNSKLKRENDELRTVMKEYERTMAEMNETAELNKHMNDESKNEVLKEKEQLQADLNSVEAAFSDLHRRYEKIKGALENFKKNEELLKKAAQDYQEKLRKSVEKYQMLKKHAEEKIETANIEINRVRRSNDSEMAVMRAALKKEQNKCASLEQAIQQKINENKELTAICDELIQRASGK